MGKGDKRTRRGKIVNKSYGKTHLRKAKRDKNKKKVGDKKAS